MPDNDPAILKPGHSVRLPRLLWIGVAMVTLFAGVVVCFVDVINARDMTLTAMGETSYRIRMYIEQNGRMPVDLAVIPARKGYANRTADGWNRDLIYTVEGNRFVPKSLGRDGVIGGKGDDADVVETYQVGRDLD